jgi:hypothetical protein
MLQLLSGEVCTVTVECPESATLDRLFIPASVARSLWVEDFRVDKFSLLASEKGVPAIMFSELSPTNPFDMALRPTSVLTLRLKNRGSYALLLDEVKAYLR